MLDLEQLIKESIVSKNTPAKLVYQAIKAEKQKFLTSKNAGNYDEGTEASIIRKLVSQHEDSMELYKKSGRADLLNSEYEEYLVLKSLVPPSVSIEKLTESLAEWLQENNLQYVPQKRMGDAIKHIKECYPTAEGREVAYLVKKHVRNE